ncbi:MAG: amidohydrolase family protein [Firmicutes bacterium]|nr:amidohydrolase family protein [Bacillota bacterium]
MYDFLFKGGVYPDYDKKEMVKGDVAVKDGKIVAVGEVEGDAAKVIDATGLVVSPGFIDIHMHEEDFQNESHEYFISDLELQQGVTTCLGGNCGKARQRLAQFLEVVEELGGLPVNYMMQAGYNGERTKLGIGRYEAATQEQIEYLTKIMTEEIEQGCIGISFGLEYDPGITFEEIMYVLNAQPQDDLFVSAHYRDDSTGAIKSIKEMIDIVEQSGKKFQIAHLSSCSAMGQMDEALPMINEAHL